MTKCQLGVQKKQGPAYWKIAQDLPESTFPWPQQSFRAFTIFPYLEIEADFLHSCHYLGRCEFSVTEYRHACKCVWYAHLCTLQLDLWALHSEMQGPCSITQLHAWMAALANRPDLSQAHQQFKSIAVWRVRFSQTFHTHRYPPSSLLLREHAKITSEAENKAYEQLLMGLPGVISVINTMLICRLTCRVVFPSWHSLTCTLLSPQPCDLCETLAMLHPGVLTTPKKTFKLEPAERNPNFDFFKYLR